jgi:hypothetical protein
MNRTSSSMGRALSTDPPPEEQPGQSQQPQPSGPSAYELEVDKQVEKYLDLKHSLTIFLITAAIGSIGFTLNFSVQHLDKINGHLERIICLSVGSMLGLLTAAFLFYALDRDMVSFRHHLKMRYEHKSYEQLPDQEQKAWDRDIGRAKNFRSWALVSLFFSILFQSMLLLSFVLY